MLDIRPATPEDAHTIHGFVSDLAEFERALDKVQLTTDDYHRYLQAGGHFDALIAEVDQQPAGMALWYKRFSTWVGDYAHLEDLYVRPEFRGQGIGTDLLKALGANTLELGMKRMEWQVLNWNEPAVRMYEGIGAAVLPDWRVCQMDESALVLMARGDTAQASPSN